jgi:hypothetical protein
LSSSSRAGGTKCAWASTIMVRLSIPWVFVPGVLRQEAH